MKSTTSCWSANTYPYLTTVYSEEMYVANRKNMQLNSAQGADVSLESVTKCRHCSLTDFTICGDFRFTRRKTIGLDDLVMMPSFFSGLAY